MLVYLRSSIFDSPAQTLVNTVNTVGVMGKGIAKDFKARYPQMYREYRALCDEGRLKLGMLQLWRGPDRWVLNFPTKTTWRRPSKLEYVEAGLQKFCDTYEKMGVTSVSFPPLGCGNGNLDWDDVSPLMEKYLKCLPIHVYVHDRQVKRDFVPEHLEAEQCRLPNDFSEFLEDIRQAVHRNRGVFQTLSAGTEFHVRPCDDSLGTIIITRNDKNELVPCEEMEHAWSLLQHGILSSDQYSGDGPRRYKSYIFPLLASLPYVQTAEIQHIRQGNHISGIGLFFRRECEISDDLKERPDQGDLWESQSSAQSDT